MSSKLNFERLYDEHAQAIFAFLINLLRNPADSHDILQELFVKIARRPELMSGVRDERGYLLRLSHNLAIDLMRRQGTRERNYEQLTLESSSVFADSNDADEQIFRTKLTEALGELPADQRAVVHLKLWEGQTFERIAETLGIPTNTAASRYRYGVDKLRERLRPIYEEIK